MSFLQVIYRALSPPYSADDPYSPEAQEQLKVTNLRVQLLKRQSCPCLSNDLNAKPPQLTYYAIYDFIVKGSCFCNGHADHCVPIKGFRPVKAAGIFHVTADKPRRKAVWRSMEGVCASITLQELTVNVVLPSTMTSPGNLQMAKQELQMNADPASAMGILTLVTLIWTHGWHQEITVVEYVITVSTILKDSIASVASEASSETSEGLSLPQMPANVRTKYLFSEISSLSRTVFVTNIIQRSFHFSSADRDWNQEIPSFHSAYNESETAWGWEDEQGYSALRHSGKCECKDQVLGNAKIFCGMKYTYMLKAKILSAHDKGSHAEVNVKIQKVLKSTKLKIVRGKRILYPESWTNRGCTCPILNPGLKYLVAGYEDVQAGRLIVNMKSFVQQWKPTLGKKVLKILKDCR
ncbi:hypothetical protein lerEdw1_003896 [Lerista edwardsae]|nr:hypothetical protein lerEdw1_003896 [Lerista edwardsae]